VNHYPLKGIYNRVIQTDAYIHVANHHLLKSIYNGHFRNEAIPAIVNHHPLKDIYNTPISIKLRNVYATKGANSLSSNTENYSSSICIYNVLPLLSKSVFSLKDHSLKGIYNEKWNAFKPHSFLGFGFNCSDFPYLRIRSCLARLVASVLL